MNEWKKDKPDYLQRRKDTTHHLGKLPPQAVDAEQAVIGATLISGYDARESLRLIPDPAYFYKEAHQLIWQSVMELSEKGIGIDIVTISQSLRTKGHLETCGGAMYITSLTAKVNSTAHLQEHCLYIKQAYIKRELITLSSQILRDSYEDTTDPFELLSQLRTGLEKVEGESQLHQEATIASVAKESIKSASERMGKPVSTFFLPTGVPELDKKMGGFAKGEPDLIILAGRPGMGKSAVLAYQAAYQLSRGVPVGIVTLEMSAQQLVNRMIVSQADNQINNSQLKYGTFNKDQYLFLERGASRFYETPAPIYDRGGLDVRMLRTMALQWKEQYNTQLLFVDYLQLLRYGNISDALKRNTEVSIALKTLAKELGHPVIALASLNRGPESRADHRPNMGDLRESGQIESDADVVQFLLRNNYYDKAVDYRDLLIIVEKNRHGETGDIPAWFDVATNRPVNFFDDTKAPF